MKYFQFNAINASIYAIFAYFVVNIFTIVHGEFLETTSDSIPAAFNESFDIVARSASNENAILHSDNFTSLYDILLAHAGDVHATDAKQIHKRSSFSSFLPPQSSSSSSSSSSFGSSNRNNFRETVYRTEGKMFHNDNNERRRLTREVHVKQGRLVGVVKELNFQSRLGSVDQFLG
jgi:hypothetical protein